MMRLILWTAGIAILSACSTSGPVSRPDPPTDPAPERRIGAETGDPRAQTLDVMLERAQTDRIAGNLVQAESTLETALRIDPGDARLWLELAEIQFAAGEFDEARTLAERAMSLAGGNAQISEAALRIRALTTP
jgi:Tfp pilus assembly protein PilF